MKDIRCPKCSRKVGEWDEKATVTLKYHCWKCNKTVVFDPETKETTVKPAQIRSTSSGAIFY